MLRPVKPEWLCLHAIGSPAVAIAPQALLGTLASPVGSNQKLSQPVYIARDVGPCTYCAPSFRIAACNGMQQMIQDLCMQQPMAVLSLMHACAASSITLGVGHCVCTTPVYPLAFVLQPVSDTLPV